MASITPALASSSLNFPISVSMSLLGSTPASVLLSALTITMKRIVLSSRCGCRSHPLPPRLPASYIPVERGSRESTGWLSNLGFERPLQQATLLEPLGHGRKAGGRASPAQLLDAGEERSIADQGGQTFEEQGQLPSFAQNSGGKVFDGTVLVEQARRRVLPDPRNAGVAIGRIAHQGQEVGNQ